MSDKKSFSECSDTVGRIVIVVMVASILIGLCYLMYLSHVSYKQQRDAIDMIMTMNRMENMNNQDYENCYRVEAIIFKQTTNETTIIQYSIPVVEALSTSASLSTGSVEGQQHVTLKVYDILGKEVATLVNRQQRPGNYKVEFDPGRLVSGIYIYRLKAGSFEQSRKMILLR